MTANASSSSATSRLEIDLLAAGRLPPLPAAFLAGRETDLLAPMRPLPPGELPHGDPPAVDRGELAAALADANAGWGHPRAAELAARLADPATRVVVTGQQPGLYGGPLLTLTKLAAAVRWAETLEAAGRPAVPVFWVATEDHDWDEMTRVALLTRDGPKSYDLGADPEALRPVGLRRFGDRLAELEERIRSDLDHDLAIAAFERARRRYRPDATFGDAFCRFLIDLLGERAPLFLDALDPAVKRLQRPWLRRLVERRGEVSASLAAAHAELERRGLPLQVTPQPGASPLFLITGGERRRIEWTEDGDGFTLRGGEGPAEPVARLLEIAEDEPERLSPGVLARPAVQDALLGTTLQIMGPAETSYLAQAAAVHRVLGVPPLWTALRPQVMVLESRQIEQLGELGVSLAEILDQPVERLLADRLGEDLVTPAQQRLEAVLDELRAPLLAVEATLESPWQKTRDQIGRAFEQLSSKHAKAVARRHDVWLRRLEKIRESCLPEEHLQERHLSVVHFLARYGPSFVDAYWRDFELDPRRLQVLEIDPGGGS